MGGGLVAALGRSTRKELGDFLVSTRLRLFTTANAIAIGLFLRLCTAAWNSLLGPSFGADPDAAGFHANATAYAQGLWLVDFQLSNTYTYALGLIYRYTASSLFLGCSLSCFAWLCSAYVLVKMMKLLAVPETHQVWGMFLYSLLPSTLLMTSVTLREAYQLLAVNGVVYLALCICISRRLELKVLLLMFVSIVCMGFLQAALLPAGLCIAALVILFVFFEQGGPHSLPKIVIAMFVFLLIAYLSSSTLLQKLFNSDLNLAAAVQERQGSWQQSARAAYSTGMRITSNFDLILFAPVSLFHYLFEPMPWKIATVSDAALFIENLIRASLLGFVAAGFIMKAFAERQRVALVFSAYVVIETIWALGTINWGTAVRHHIPAFGLLVLSAFAYSTKPVCLPVREHNDAVVK